PQDDDRVGSFLAPPGGGGYLADTLERHAGRAVTDRRRRVNTAADAIGNGHGEALRFAGCVRKTVDNRITSFGQDTSSPFDGFLDRGRAARNRSYWAVFDLVIEKPCFAENAGIFCLRNLVTFDR